jgi:hypothetical protein
MVYSLRTASVMPTLIDANGGEGLLLFAKLVPLADIRKNDHQPLSNILNGFRLTAKLEEALILMRSRVEQIISTMK